MKEHVPPPNENLNLVWQCILDRNHDHILLSSQSLEGLESLSRSLYELERSEHPQRAQESKGEEGH